MPRSLCALAVLAAATALVLTAAPPSGAPNAPVRADEPKAGGGLAGNWTLTVPIDREQEILMLVSFAEKDGKWTAEYLGSNVELKVKPAVTAVKVTGDAVEFTIGFMGRELASFDGVLSKDKKKLNGSLVVLGGRIRT